MKKKASVLITGSSGFIGTNLYDVLHTDFDLYGLDITTQGRFPPDSVYSWDQIDRIPDVDVIIHLAGIAHDVKRTRDDRIYFAVNTGLSKKIYDYFIGSSAGKFIFFSSVKAVADTVAGEVLVEKVLPKPLTPYGKSKLEAEKYIIGKKLPYGKSFYILRPCMIHGPGNKGNLNLLYKMVKKRIPYPLGAFENKRSFVSIGNMSFVIRELMDKNVPSGTYQIADDETLSTNQIIESIAFSQVTKPRIWHLNRSFIKKAARIGDVLRLPLNSERLKKLTESYVVSNEKIKNALEVDKMPVSAIDGLTFTLSSFNRGVKDK